MRPIHIPVEQLSNYRGGSAFNCSLVEHRGSTTLFFRYEHRPSRARAVFDAIMRPIPAVTALWKDSYTEIGSVELNPDLSIRLGSFQAVPLEAHPRIVTLDDPRVLVHEGRLVLVHSRCWYVGRGLNLAWSSSVDVDLLGPDRRSITHWTPQYGGNVDLYATPFENNPLREKNWSPFSCQGELRFVYTVNPLVVIRLDLNSGHVREVSRQPEVSMPRWRWGEISGGTPLLPWRDGYAGFFHSKKRERSGKKEEWAYYAGFYAISASEPHRITHISAVPLLSGTRDDSFDRRPKSAHSRPVVVYPCGWLERNGSVLVSAGWNDSRCMIYEMTWDEILQDVMELKPPMYRGRVASGAA